MKPLEVPCAQLERELSADELAQVELVIGSGRTVLFTHRLIWNAALHYATQRIYETDAGP